MHDLLHLADSHGDAVCKERREVGDIGESEVSPGAPDGTDSSIVIKQELIQIRRSAAGSSDGSRSGTHISVILEDVETSHLSRCPLQISHERGGLGGIGGLSDSLESGSEDERDSSGELHSAKR